MPQSELAFFASGFRCDCFGFWFTGTITPFAPQVARPSPQGLQDVPENYCEDESQSSKNPRESFFEVVADVDFTFPPLAVGLNR